MEALHKKYIVDEHNNKIAVQIDMMTFNKLEEVLENYGLYQLMLENKDDEKLDHETAKTYYYKIKKNP